MKRRVAVLVAAVAGLSLTHAAAAYDASARLNDVVRVYSLDVGEVRCASQAEWDANPASRVAWSYTNLRHDYSVLAPFLCDGAANVGGAVVPLWQQAAGAWTLVRESFHLRHWRFRRNEAKVLCQAIVYFTDAAVRLGATEQQANELYPYALALHRQTIELYPWLRDPRCVVPPWIPPPRPLGLRAPSSADALDEARRIGAQVDTRYAGLRVSETSSTAVIESLTLFDRADEPRIVPTDRGIYYAVCPNGARCPYPGRAARPATALAPRRVALELAARTFIETSADLVVVSLPTPRFILLVFERDTFDAESVSERLTPYLPADRSLQLRSVVDANTLPRLYVPFGLFPTASGRDSLLALPLSQTP